MNTILYPLALNHLLSFTCFRIIGSKEQSKLLSRDKPLPAYFLGGQCSNTDNPPKRFLVDTYLLSSFMNIDIAI